MCAAAGDTEFLDLRGADGAGLAGAGEDLELVLELASLAKSVVVGVKGRAAQLDSPTEYVAGRTVNKTYLFPREGVRLAGRVNPGGEEHLVHVDVAESRDDRLIQEQALYGGPALEGTNQVMRMIVGRELSRQ